MKFKSNLARGGDRFDHRSERSSPSPGNVHSKLVKAKAEREKTHRERERKKGKI